VVTLILPLLHRDVTVFPGPNLPLSDEMYIRKMRDEDKGLIFSQAPEGCKSLLQEADKCLYIDKLPMDDRGVAQDYAVQARFLLNIFRAAQPVCIPFGLFVTAKGRARKRLTVIQLEGLAGDRPDTYKIRGGASREDFVEFFKVLNKAYANFAPVRYTLDRFNGALLRHNSHDRIVDLAIALESLYENKSELSFTLSLYTAILAEEVPAKRQQAFTIAKRLYDARSKIVHTGDAASQVAAIENDWVSTERVVSNAIKYYVMFLYSHPTNAAKEWSNHLRQLALGMDKRVTESELEIL
jgi:hypothetical protein